MSYENERQEADELMMSAVRYLIKLEKVLWMDGKRQLADKIGFASSNALEAFNMIKEIESKSRIADMDNKMQAFDKKMKEAEL